MTDYLPFGAGALTMGTPVGLLASMASREDGT